MKTFRQYLIDEGLFDFFKKRQGYDLTNPKDYAKWLREVKPQEKPNTTPLVAQPTPKSKPNPKQTEEPIVFPTIKALGTTAKPFKSDYIEVGDDVILFDRNGWQIESGRVDTKDANALRISTHQGVYSSRKTVPFNKIASYIRRK